MDQQIFIPSDDGKTICGLFNQADIAAPADRLVILVHGLTGRPREFLHVMAMRTFCDSGYDVARLSCYDGSPNARTLRSSTVDIHARDINTCVDYYRARYKNIFVAGHSYGGFSLLFANPAVNAVSFWDATWTPGWYKDVQPVPVLDCFAFNNGQESLIGRAMYEEAANYAQNPPIETAANFKSPAQVILAMANEKPGRSREKLFEYLGVADKELVKIDGADHQFTQGKTVELLTAATKSWFDRHF
jgi:esterase/lipase